MAYVKKRTRTRRNTAAKGGIVLICGLIATIAAVITVGRYLGARNGAEAGADNLAAAGVSDGTQTIVKDPEGLPLSGGGQDAGEQLSGENSGAASDDPEGILPEPEIVITERDGVTYLSVKGHEMILVNKEYSLPSDYGDGITDEAAAALDSMMQAAAQDGIDLWVVSGFRSYDTQKSIHDRYVNDYGSEYAARISALAGQSEHQTGLAFDLNSLSDSFCETAEYAWLSENAAKYGFILRFPRGKEWATGYIFEPWHYRYVGVELAEIFSESGLSVEEYAGIEHSPNPEA